MSTPLSMIAQGQFTSDGAARTLQFPQSVDYFMIRNRSIWGSNPADLVVESTYYADYAAGQATTISEANTGVMSATLVAAGGAGFRAIDQSTFTDGAAVALNGTEITNANPAVASTATTPVVGDIVRIINPTTMLQIGGMEFEVTAVTLNTNFTMGNLDASGFAGAATGGSYRVVNDARYFPRRRWITNITAATAAVVTTSINHGYAVGARITLHVPTGFGMIQAEGLTGQVTAITAGTLTTDIDTSTFTAFAFPTSAIAATGVSFPYVIPFGEISTVLTQSTDNDTLFGLNLGTAVVGSNTDVMDWVAYSREYTI